MIKSFKHLLYNIIFKTGRIIFFFRKRKIDNKNIRKIIVASLYFRGDTLFHTPALRMLRKLYPESQIDVWVKSRSEEVLQGNTNINDVIVFDNIRTANYNEKVSLDLMKKIEFALRIRKRKYDLYIDLTGKYSTALIGLLFKTKYSIGLNYNGFGFCYTKFIDLDTSASPGHLIDKYLSIVKIGLDVPDIKWKDLLNGSGNKPDIFIDEFTKQLVEKELEQRINNENPLIAIHPTAGWTAKEWAPEKFSLLIERLINELHYNVVIVGDKSDSDKINIILGKINKVPENIIKNIFLPLSLKGTSEIIRKSNVFIGGDSVPLHLANTVETPSIGLFGPTNPEFSKPFGPKHIYIYHKLYCSAPDNHQFCTRDAGKSCPSIDCMIGITVSEVLDKLEILINEYYRGIA